GSEATCEASSRVGTSTSDDGAPPPAGVRSTTGTPKASVLPEPVGDLASTSVPASASGKTRVWILKGARKPAASRASATSTLTPSARKDCCDIVFDSLGSGSRSDDSKHPKEEREAQSQQTNPC